MREGAVGAPDCDCEVAFEVDAELAPSGAKPESQLIRSLIREDPFLAALPLLWFDSSHPQTSSRVPVRRAVLSIDDVSSPWSFNSAF